MFTLGNQVYRKLTKVEVLGKDKTPTGRFVYEPSGKVGKPHATRKLAMEAARGAGPKKAATPAAAKENDE